MIYAPPPGRQRGERVEKRNDGLSFTVSCNKFGWTRSWGISRSRFHMALGLLGAFLVGALFSFFFSYSLYGQAEDIRAEKEKRR